jgi:hypothetical protein
LAGKGQGPSPPVVIPAKAGIQGRKIGPVALDPRFRGGDGRREDELYAAFSAVFRWRMLSLFSWPQAAMMSRPRGVRTGLA